MANDKTLATKQLVIDEIVNKVKESSSVVFFEYSGLTVHELGDLRRKLRNIGSDLKVYKNTLAKRALDTLNFDMNGELQGPKAVVFGTDSIAPIKMLAEYAKKYPALELRIGIVDGKVTDKSMLHTLAVLPTKEESLTMFASGLLQHLKEFAIGLDLYSQKLEK